MNQWFAIPGKNDLLQRPGVNDLIEYNLIILKGHFSLANNIKMAIGIALWTIDTAEITNIGCLNMNCYWSAQGAGQAQTKTKSGFPVSFYSLKGFGHYEDITQWFLL